jgi:hypothetical protein
MARAGKTTTVLLVNGILFSIACSVAGQSTSPTGKCLLARSLATRLEKAGAGSATILSVPAPTSPAYHLESKPGSANVIYLDFDGQFLPASTLRKYTPTPYTGTSLKLGAANVSANDIITIWKTIREDFIPFDVNVTTDSVVFRNASVGKRQQCIFTPDDEWIGVLGAALLGSFQTDEPCFAFTKFNKGKAAAEVGSHELGHTFGLTHDGTFAVPEYYNGHGTAPNTWSPIMGGSHSANVTQWSKGEYQNANNAQDDLTIIASRLGYRTDEAGSTLATAKALVVDLNGTISTTSNSGIIATATDVDVYTFTTTGGTVIIDANAVYAPNNAGTQTAISNLDILLQLKDNAGTVLTSSDDQYTLGGSITLTVAAGTYSISIEGTGYLNALTTGYSDYASVGEYVLSGTIPQMNNNQFPVVKMITRSYQDIDYTIDHFFTPKTVPIFLSALASDADGTISNVEFYTGNTKLSNATVTNPYGYLLIANTAGLYSITARATDDDGNIAISTPMMVEVFEPQVNILSPLTNSIQQENSNVTIAAFADVHWSRYIDKVEFFEGTTLLTTKTTLPYTYTLPNVAVGTHTISVKATLSYYFNVTTTANVTFTVLPEAPGDFIRSEENVCQGTTGLVYSVPEDAGATYVWTYDGTGLAISSGDGTHAVTADFSSTATSGTLAVTATRNGVTSAARTLAIAVNNDPTQPSTITGDVNPLKGSTGNQYSVVDNSGTTYDWSYAVQGATIHGNGANAITLDFTTAATSGELRVKASNACGTSDVSVLALELTDNITAIEENPLHRVTLSPNPAANSFLVTVPSTFKVIYITIVNTLGQCVYSSKLYGGEAMPIYLANAGAYSVNIRAGEYVTSKKVIIL